MDVIFELWLGIAGRLFLRVDWGGSFVSSGAGLPMKEGAAAETSG